MCHRCGSERDLTPGAEGASKASRRAKHRGGTAASPQLAIPVRKSTTRHVEGAPCLAASSQSMQRRAKNLGGRWTRSALSTVTILAATLEEMNCVDQARAWRP